MSKLRDILHFLWFDGFQCNSGRSISGTELEKCFQDESKAEKEILAMIPKEWEVEGSDPDAEGYNQALRDVKEALK
jgi:hypothetical protein